jgi:hypothetical protein
VSTLKSSEAPAASPPSEPLRRGLHAQARIHARQAVAYRGQ